MKQNSTESHRLWMGRDSFEYESNCRLQAWHFPSSSFRNILPHCPIGVLLVSSHFSSYCWFLGQSVGFNLLGQRLIQLREEEEEICTEIASVLARHEANLYSLSFHRNRTKIHNSPMRMQSRFENILTKKKRFFKVERIFSMQKTVFYWT